MHHKWFTTITKYIGGGGLWYTQDPQPIDWLNQAE